MLGAVMLEIIVSRVSFLGVETWLPVVFNVVLLWIVVLLVGLVFERIFSVGCLARIFSRIKHRIFRP